MIIMEVFTNLQALYKDKWYTPPQKLDFSKLSNSHLTLRKLSKNTLFNQIHLVQKLCANFKSIEYVQLDKISADARYVKVIFSFVNCQF